MYYNKLKLCILIAALLPTAFSLNNPTNGGSGSSCQIVHSADPYVQLLKHIVISSTESSLMLKSLGSTNIIPVAIEIISSGGLDLTMKWPVVSAVCSWMNMIAAVKNSQNSDEKYAYSGEITIPVHATAGVLEGVSSSASASANTPSLAATSSFTDAQLIVRSSNTMTLRPRATSGATHGAAEIGWGVGVVLVALTIMGSLFMCASKFKCTRRFRKKEVVTENTGIGPTYATSDGLMLPQLEDGTVRHQNLVALPSHLGENSIELIPRGALFVPPGTRFDPLPPLPTPGDAVHSADSEVLPPTDDTPDSDRPDSPITISTARAIRGAVRYKVVNEPEGFPGDKTRTTPEQLRPSAEQGHPELIDSGSRHNSAVLPVRPSLYAQELNDQGGDLTVEESVLLLEFQDIVHRLEAIRSTRTRPNTPPPEYTSL